MKNPLLKLRTTFITAVGAMTALTAITACSSVPERNAALDEARGRFASAQQSPEVARLASEELRSAAESLMKADKAFADREPKGTIDHLAYMTAQKTVVARETAANRSAQAVTAGAAAERNSMRLEQRTNEADDARRQLAVAEEINARKTSELVRADTAAQLDQARINSSDARANSLEMQLQELNAKKTERGIVVTLGDVLFDSGQARLMPAGAGAISRLTEAFKANPGMRASIEGYTDSQGSTAANYELSDRRASAVKSALVSGGVNADQLTTRGFGESNPAAGNDSAAGRQMNRRVEIVFSSTPGVTVVK